MNPVLAIEDLVVSFDGYEGPLTAVGGVSLSVNGGEILAVVGESGSGKSVTALSILGLLPTNASVESGSIRLEGKDLLGMKESELRDVRGRDIAMIFQEPISALNPLIRVGAQITEAIRAHKSVKRSEAEAIAIELLRSVHVPAPERRMSEYPHQFSGGMAQRVAIAIALANEPRLLIADEPTTALDVTVQAQVLKTLRQAQQQTQAAMILITHDMGLVAETADRVTVMYAGRVVESGPVDVVLRAPSHPYTRGLLRSLPRIDGEDSRLIPIQGQPRLIGSGSRGCAFEPRCDLSKGRAVCSEVTPELMDQSTGAAAACHFSSEMVGT
jgi:peptide/nickel transport system ATP-binding protein